MYEPTRVEIDVLKFTLHQISRSLGKKRVYKTLVLLFYANHLDKLALRLDNR